MSLDKMSKDDLELLSYKDIAAIIVEEEGAKNTLELFEKIVKLLELPKSTVDNKISEFYTTLSTDKNFLLLEDGKWDLRKRHTSDKVLKDQESDEDEDEDEEEQDEDKLEMSEDEEDYDSQVSDEDDFDDGDDDLKDLVVLDEEELDLEQ